MNAILEELGRPLTPKEAEVEIIQQTQTHYTPKQLAERWHISHITLACWRCKGSGPDYIKWGKTILYPVSAITDWEESHKRSNTSQ